MADLSGQMVGRYHIIERLGEGGMATVYKGYDTRLERNIAVKVIRTEQVTDSDFLKRFEREAKALARLDHTNIVKVLDYGEHNGVPYLIMVYLPGGTLKEKLGSPMPYQEAARLIAPIARALEYAHKMKIIHRDVKPANILLNNAGQPMLSDFGIAKMLEQEQATMLTSAGVGIGTPEYMAPEQWMGNVTHQTDIYSLGVVFYELVTGRRPYSADTPAAVLLKQASEPLPRPRSFVPTLSENVEKVIFKSLAKKPEDRYQTMEEFALALERLQHDIPSPDDVPTDEMQVATVVKEKEDPAAIQALIAQAQTQEVQRNYHAALDSYRRAMLLCVHGSPLAQRIQYAINNLENVIQAQDRSSTGIRGGSTVTPYPQEQPKRRNWVVGALIAVVAVVVLGIIIIGGGFLVFQGMKGKGMLAMLASPTTTPSITPSPTATPTLTVTPTITPSPSQTPEPTLGAGSSIIAEVDGMPLMFVPAGDFLMGSTDSDAADEEKPQHTVYLDAFWIDKFEVTNAMYQRCVSEGACDPPTSYESRYRSEYYGLSGFADYPVMFVTWYMAQDYCTWAGRRLPTEAEWEKAARGTDGRRFPWGNQGLTGTLVNFADVNTGFEHADTSINDGYEDTAPVGSYPDGVSPYGAMDLAGNLREWVSDWFSSTYYDSSPSANPQGPGSGEYKIMRGGSWGNSVYYLRSSFRGTLGADESKDYVGFRCALPANQ